jgi:hypothetical protein
MKIDALSGYHDAELVNIRTGPGGAVFLGFRLADGSSRQLNLVGCELFRIVDVTLQNVASRVMVFKGSEIPVEYVDERLIWASSMIDASSFLSVGRRESLIQQITSSQKMLVVVEPSCGAEVVATCAEYIEQ